MFFMLAIVQFSAWISSLIGEMIRATRGDTPLDTNQEIVMAYLIMMSAPVAFLSLGTIILAALSDDVSPSSDRRNMNPDRDLPIGHLPEIEENDNGEVIDMRPSDETSSGKKIIASL